MQPHPHPGDPSPPPGPAGAESEFARRTLQAGPPGIVRFALNNKSRDVRGVLARAATRGLIGLPGLDVLLRGLASPDGSREAAIRLVEGGRPRVFLALAGLLANQRYEARDVEDATNLYDLVLEAHGPGAFADPDRLHFLELLSDEQAVEEFEEAFAGLRIRDHHWRQVLLMVANMVNPWASSGQDGDLGLWRRYVQAVFVGDGVEAIDVDAVIGTPFDSILCTSSAVRTGGPVVTVLVPTHNPGPRLSTALASLVNQTWQELEILVLDDGSDPSHRHHMEAWVERDPRIRVLTMSSNVGNYAARNVGLAAATGELVTVHDDDDWSHPRKIETQVDALLTAPDTLANMSRLVRASSDLRFTRINDNPSYIQPNYSSLMFRREPVLAEFGYWCEVNRAADAEFRNRITAAAGPPAVVGDAPLSFLRVRGGSLTSSELNRGYVDPRRRWFDMASRGWHQDAVARGESLRLAAGEVVHPFSAPRSMKGRGDRSRIDVDVVYATEFRFPGGNTSVAVAEIRALLESGRRVGLLQLDSPVLDHTNSLTRRIRELSRHPGVTVVSSLDDVACDLLLVRHPTVLQFAAPTRSRVRAQRGVLVVNHAPSRRDGSGRHYDLEPCLDNFEAMFGFRPEVAPESGVIRELLVASLPELDLATFDWPGIVTTSAHQPRRPLADRPPVIGRHSRDHGDKWPVDPVALAAAYPVDGSRDVRVLGGADVAATRLGRMPDGWSVHPFGSMAPADFLEGVDFWVYFHADALVESFGMASVEAMASGAVVILPEYMAATFGPGAVYCSPDRTQKLIDELWSDPDRYEQQSAAGIEVATTRFTVDRFLERVAAAGR